MALLNSIKTLQLDPVIFNSQRCEFRLPPDKVYLSNWRLADIGATGTNDANGKNYVHSSGAYSLIKSIVLYNDNVVIANLYNANDYLAFANIGRTNSNSVNMARFLNRNKVGYSFNASDQIQLAEAFKGGLAPQTITDAEASTSRAWLDLTLPLPFLKATSTVDSRQLQNLRLVIEWAPHASETDLRNIVANLGASPIAGGTSLKILRPTIILDEMIDPKAIARVKNSPIQYINLDSERVVVDAMGAATTQNVNQRLRAFDDRRINRLLMINKVATPNASLGGNYSQAMFKENVQFTLNGQQLIPYKGIDTPLKKQTFLTDSWGLRNAPQGSQFFSSLGYSDYNSLSDLERNLSYGGLSINSEINELQLQYSREVFTSSASATVASYSDSSPIVATLSSPLYVGSLSSTTAQVTISGAGGTDADDLNKDHVLGTVGDGTKQPLKYAISGVDGAQTLTANGTMSLTNTVETNASKTGFDLLFWGEVNKVMTVRDNRVAIAV